jgi:hypothetical protein
VGVSQSCTAHGSIISCTHSQRPAECVQVKNVTGRLLVGLRWWNEGNSETGEAWRFESLAEVRSEQLSAAEAGHVSLSALLCDPHSMPSATVIHSCLERGEKSSTRLVVEAGKHIATAMCQAVLRRPASSMSLAPPATPPPPSNQVCLLLCRAKGLSTLMSHVGSGLCWWPTLLCGRCHASLPCWA